MGNDCSESRLRSFLNDHLPEPETRRLSDHLDDCEACRQALDSLAACSDICAELRETGPDTGPLQPLRDVPKVNEPISLVFLKPSAKPGSLGRLGPYDVTEVLGRGAFGVVLKASDPALSRFVAIKVLASQFAVNATARTRFAREAKAAAAVVHENVVAIHAVDSWNGLPYLVMPCIAGRSLQERVDRDGPLAVKEVLRVGMQAARGLAAAHDQGLVHRDIKPSNILLENGVERVKLSDFGLARAVDDASQTQSGVIAGTPQYMSPEQARGETVDHRSDLFSLGGVMYFMCAGHSPFRADSTPAVLKRVCDDRHRPLRDVNPDVPDWLAAVVDRLLAKEAGGRFSTADEVAGVLKHHLAELQRTGTTSTLRPNPSPVVRKPSRRIVVAAIALTSAVLLASVARRGIYKPFLELTVFGSNGAPKAVDRNHASNGTQRPVLAAAGQFQDTRIIGSGVSATKVWEIADFSSVQVGSTFRAEITRGDKFKVTTSADDNVIEHIQVVKKGKTLIIGLERGLNFQLKEPLKAELVIPALDALDVGGASDVKLSGFRSQENFKLKLSGASHVVGSMEVGDAEIDVSGASYLTLNGSAKAGHLLLSGASHLKLAEFPLKQCEIHLSGASYAGLTVQTGLKATASGASRLDGSVEATDVSLKLDGASVVSLQGKADSALLVAAGASQVGLAKLILGEVDVKLSNASRATVDARKSLKYDLKSSSHLEYSGNPATLTGNKSKSATVTRRR
jgi:serine/threonine-protein kinase